MKRCSQRNSFMIRRLGKPFSRAEYFSRRREGNPGPKGRNVNLEKSFGSPTVTKDGLPAKEIELEDKFENMGAQMVREVASKTSDIAGDGTTTATVLAQANLSRVQTGGPGHNPMELKRGIERGVEVVIEELKKTLQAHQRAEGNFSVGKISANNDENYRHIIAEAMAKVGKEGSLP